jgi:hypothetical protein
MKDPDDPWFPQVRHGPIPPEDNPRESELSSVGKAIAKSLLTAVAVLGGFLLLIAVIFLIAVLID